VWARVLEWCADVFAATSRPKKRRIFATLLGLAILAYVGLPLAVRFGLESLLPVGALVTLGLLAARRVFVAREQVWRAACLGLDDPRQRPDAAGDRAFVAPSAVALAELALAVDDVRRGRFAEASERVPRISRELLRDEELRLLEGVRACVTLGLGDMHRAAQQAIVALPTGSDELDGMLGRALLRDAWSSPVRVDAIDAAWQRSGVAEGDPGTLPRLRRLIRVRVATEGLDALSPDEARVLAEEAEAVGDGDLSAELAARGRASRAYR
jgi:hypothetical protein